MLIKEYMLQTSDFFYLICIQEPVFWNMEIVIMITYKNTTCNPKIRTRDPRECTKTEFF